MSARTALQGAEPDPAPNRIRALREALSLSQASLAERARTTQSQIDRLEKGQRRLTIDWMARLSSALGVAAADLLPGARGWPAAARPAVAAAAAVPLPERPSAVPFGHLPRDVPVLGQAVGGPGPGQGGAAGADFLLNGQPIDYVRRPPGLAQAHAPFAVRVTGSSMWPRFEEGALVFVQPGRPARPGDDVLVEFHPETDGAPPHCVIKRLLRRTAGALLCQQFNPAREDLVYPLSGVRQVLRILTVEDLLGA